MRAQPHPRTARAPGSECGCVQCTLITAETTPGAGAAVRAASPAGWLHLSQSAPSSPGPLCRHLAGKEGVEAGVQSPGTSRSA